VRWLRRVLPPGESHWMYGARSILKLEKKMGQTDGRTERQTDTRPLHWFSFSAVSQEIGWEQGRSRVLLARGSIIRSLEVRSPPVVSRGKAPVWVYGTKSPRSWNTYSIFARNIALDCLLITSAWNRIIWQRANYENLTTDRCGGWGSAPLDLLVSYAPGWEERLRSDLFCVGWDVKP